MGKNRTKQNQQTQGKTMPDQDQDQATLKALAENTSNQNSESDKPSEDQAPQLEGGEDGTSGGQENLDQTEGGAPEDKPVVEGDAGGAPPDGLEPEGGGDEPKDPADAPAPAVVGQGVSAPLEEVKEPAPVVETVQVAAKPTEAEVADIGTSVTDTSDLGKLLNKIDIEGTQQQKTLVFNLNKYMDDMLPGKPMPAQQGAQNQMRLWDILRGIVENPDPVEFRRQMFIARAFFKRYAKEKTALNDRYIHRFADAWTRSNQHLTAMQRLINILVLTADPLTTADNLKQVDLARSMEVYFSEATRQRLMSYYQS